MPTPVEIFQAAVDALNRTDRDALTRLIDPEIAFIPLRTPVTGPFIGYQGMEDYLDENAARFDLFHADFEEMRPLPDGRLLAYGFVRMRSRGGDVETRYRTAGIASFRDDRLASWRDYGDVDAALAAANVN